MDIWAIASVTDAETAGSAPVQVDSWNFDETGWPLDEEGRQVEGHFDEQSLNFVKGGKGKGKGKGPCYNCGNGGHKARDC